MFGPVIGCIGIAALLAFSSPIAGLVFLIVYIVYSQIENNVIAPKIQGSSLKLSPVIILVAITIGIYTFGILGAIISIPIAGCIKILIEEYPNLRATSEEKETKKLKA
jgi:predicted PurR-regulated permease PerM